MVATSFRATGMQPVSWFPDSRSSSRLESRPNPSGMLPVNEFVFSFRWVSLSSLPSSDGMLPLRLSSDSSTFVTRLGVPLVVTPSQPVMAVSTLQFNAAVPRSVSFAASRLEQSFTSPRFVLGLVTAVPVGACRHWRRLRRRPIGVGVRANLAEVRAELVRVGHKHWIVRLGARTAAVGGDAGLVSIDHSLLERG